MTPEEKARAYDEALSKCKAYIDDTEKRWSEEFSRATEEVFKEIFPELKESEDERIRKELIEFVCKNADRGKDLENKKGWLAYLEKQKDTTSVLSLQQAYREGFDNAIKAVKQNPEYNWLEKRHIEQKPNIELIQRSWYLEGYHDGKYKREPKWIIKAQEGGPKHELNPRYGEPLADERKSMELERLVKAKEVDIEIRGFLKGVEVGKRIEQKPESISCGHENDKPAEWSKEDEDKVDDICKLIEHATIIPRSGDDDTGTPPTRLNDKYKGELKTFVKSLRPQPKQEREPMEIKFGGKIYQVHGVRTLPGGITGYIIEDEPGHYDCIFKPEEVLGGGYGVKQNGSPYPTKAAIFDYPHWKPSEEQMEALQIAVNKLAKTDVADSVRLSIMYDNIKKQM